MTVLEVIQHSARFLEGKGVESPRLQGELILAQVLKLPRLQLYLRFDQVLTGAETAAARELVIAGQGQTEFNLPPEAEEAIAQTGPTLPAAATGHGPDEEARKNA